MHTTTDPDDPPSPTPSPATCQIRSLGRRPLRWARTVLLVQLALSALVYGWSITSGLSEGWGAAEWASVLGALWILPTATLYVGLAVVSRQAPTSDRQQRETVRRRTEEVVAAHQENVRADIRRLLEQGSLTAHFQPIVRLASQDIVGYEALARFPTGTPHSWFTAAAEVGMTEELELEAVRQAFAAARELSAGVYVSVNVSPITLESRAIFSMVRDFGPERVVVEITEHLAVEDYARTRHTVSTLRRTGVRLAVDDAGAGFASLRHIVNLQPEYIKLDHSLVDGIHFDPSRRAMARALTSFAAEVGATVVAEGIEQHAEMVTIRNLGIEFGQGYVLAEPAGVEHWVANSLAGPSPLDR